jgi:hypothetical protein
MGAGLSSRQPSGNFTRMRAWFVGMGFVLLASLARADRADDLARLHLEVTGGAQRVAALKAFRATGTVQMDGGQVRFLLIAARPNLVRLESEAGGRAMVQAYDGVEPPWEYDTGMSPPRSRDMPDAAAKRIMADAEFDDPLIAGKARGFVFDFAGETEVEGRRFFRLLVTYRLTETFSMLLDPETYLIAYRTETHVSGGGRQREIVTHYDRYLPVDGVLLPHQITTATDGVVTQVMTIDRIDANPPVTIDTFSRPLAVAPQAF